MDENLPVTTIHSIIEAHEYEVIEFTCTDMHKGDDLTEWLCSAFDEALDAIHNGSQEFNILIKIRPDLSGQEALDEMMNAIKTGIAPYIKPV